MLTSLSQASLPYYLLRATMSPDHLQTHIELKNFLSSRYIYLHEGICGRSKNHLLASSESGQMACIKRYPKLKQEIRGELYSYHFSQWLGHYNVPAIVLTRLSYTDEFWSPWKSKLIELGWHDGDYLVVSHYYQQLSDVTLPDILRTNKTLNLTTKGHYTKTEITQWSNLIVQDYLSGDTDRLVNTLVNLEHNKHMYSYPIHNLGQTKDLGLIAYDHDYAFGVGYDFALSKRYQTLNQKYQRYQVHFLNRLCLFSSATQQKLETLSSYEDPAQILEDYIQRVDLDSFLLVKPLTKEHRTLFKHRIRHALKHLHECQATPSINP
ncbi:hypothetical protein [Endozoicomonas numazuensis]|uniref:hypothetical protein n=1 Tax=Endozoicomonas numazuensis TaxID=1137799 RepID=UPI001F16E6D5|nr:hypothetical protein [Endozoicomonas numazuensis]